MAGLRPEDGEKEMAKILGQKNKPTAVICGNDGVLMGKLTTGKVLRVTVAKAVVRLLHPAGVGFYGLARQKLGWSGSTARGGR